MNIPRNVAVHEAGHLVVGHLLGLTQQCIDFHPSKADEVASAWYKKRDAESSLIRCFGGLLAELHFSQDKLSDSLCKAYGEKTVFTSYNSIFESLPRPEQNLFIGARTDLQDTEAYARQIQPNDVESVSKRIREAEAKATAMVEKSAPGILMVANDIIAFGLEPENNQVGIYILDQRGLDLNAHCQP